MPPSSPDRTCLSRGGRRLIWGGAVILAILTSACGSSATSSTASSSLPPITTSSTASTTPSTAATTSAPPASATPKPAFAPLSSLGKLEAPADLITVGPEGVAIPHVPALSGTQSKAMGNTVDGIKCLGQEQLLFHIHAHLTVFVNGGARQVPYAIGIVNPQLQNTPEGPFVGGGSCFYWLHTHAADGIIHIESPVQRIFTLGNFFDVWGEPLSRTQVGPSKGHVTALYNGQVFLGNPRNIPLNAHAQIQLDVGKPLIAPVKIAFPSGL
jgi:hypothetical protein